MIPAIVVVLPLVLAAFLAIALNKDPAPIKYIALFASLISLAFTVYLFLYGQTTFQSFNWFNLGGYSFNLSTITAPLNIMMLLLVSIVTPLIFLYSFGYMQTPSEQSRFYSEICLFAVAMMLFAISSGFITLLLSWELLGITSYLLIGFYYRRDAAPLAARKAITTILIGDIAMIAAIVLLVNLYHSLDYAVVLTAPPSGAFSLAMLLIAIAIFTKSAQFPFHEWLSDAMEGPTPVSAFLHSSTMVKAGVFLVAILLPAFATAGLSNLILAVGIISAIIGASNALTERHIKKILAYSTIEDLGLMFVALGLGSLFAAMMLFVAQTFYKALLFMGAGAIIKANDGREDIFNVYNSSSNKIVFASLIIGALSIAAIPPLGGFFGKTAVDGSASNILLYIALLIMGLATSIYTFRWLIIPTRSNGPTRMQTELVMYPTTPKSMVIPMVVLAFGVIASSLAYFYMPSYLLLQGTGAISVTAAVIETFVAAIGIAIAYKIYGKNARMYLSSTHRFVYAALHNTTIVNGVYNAIVAVILLIADVVTRFDFALDKLIYTTANDIVAFGKIGKVVVNGQTNVYVLAFALGIVLLVVAFVV